MDLNISLSVEPSSETQGLLIKMMRYFREQVYFNSRQTPGHFILIKPVLEVFEFRPPDWPERYEYVSIFPCKPGVAISATA